MFTWLAENAATIIALSAVILLIAAAVIALIKENKSKKGKCTGNCATCCMGCSYGAKKK
ncbi:MAG: FeoB-associated Cys-rich membrane protein [Clostridia bacterium]|jgi:hypothetical protein|nr:FeoB-associated Cys-rich membrane protein [Clostridia bacterium]